MEWISVEDRVPEDFLYVLGWADEWGIFFGYFDGLYWKRGGYINEPITMCAYIALVTHWQPLPEQPQ